MTTDPQHLRDLLAKATPGPWAVNPVRAQVDAFHPRHLPVLRMLWPTEHRTESETHTNAELIVAMHNALPALLDRLEAAERERDQARANIAHLMAGIEQANKWRNLFGDVARALKCLPSSFPSQNDHVYQKAERVQLENDQLKAEVERLRGLLALLWEDAEIYEQEEDETRQWCPELSMYLRGHVAVVSLIKKQDRDRIVATLTPPKEDKQ